MDLKTIKLLEDLRKQVDNARQALTEKRREAGDALVRQAVDDFMEHFSRNGFHAKKTDSGATATYETASFVLITEKPSQAGTHTDIVLKPPAQDKELQATVVQSTGSARAGSLSHGGDVQKQLEDELSFLERALREPAPIFSLHVRDDGGRGIRGKIYKNYADLLMIVYPD